MKTPPYLRRKFSIGDKVEKPEGYPFPGTVISAFFTMKGDLRYVVEHDCGGLLHIFNEIQLRKVSK